MNKSNRTNHGNGSSGIFRLKNVIINCQCFLTFPVMLLVIGCAKEDVSVPAPIPEFFNTITAGRLQSYAIEPNGSLWGWGSVPNGGGTRPGHIATGYVAIASGSGHTLALKTDGTLWSWGLNESGQVGNDTKLEQLDPVQIGTGYSAIDAGGKGYTEMHSGEKWWEFYFTNINTGHSIGLKVDGTLWAWGSQPGDGTNQLRTIPVMIGEGYISISAGGGHSLALKDQGSLWAWGQNNNGQLGDGTKLTRNSPVQIDSGYMAISAGGQHTLAIKKDGTLWAWGLNEYGQLGDGTNETRTRPVMIGSDFKAISAGGDHSLALKSDGSLWAWGQNEFGQLGDGSIVNRSTPVLIDSGYTAISAGSGRKEVNSAYAYQSPAHSLGLKEDGTVWAWGFNGNGQLGDGTKVDRHLPTQINPH